MSIASDNPALTSSLLYLDGVAVSFDGYKALRGLSLVLAPGEMRAIIGPNGAGKTTMMDIITGKTRADTGDVYFAGTHDLSKLDEATIAELGIGKVVQHFGWDGGFALVIAACLLSILLLAFTWRVHDRRMHS